MDYYKVKDHGDLVRDPQNGAILNTNSMDYDKYVAQRQSNDEGHKKTENIEQDLVQCFQSFDDFHYWIDVVQHTYHNP